MENFYEISRKEIQEKIRNGALLNPRIDSTFKALFTQPTPESKDALHAFLEAATERKIKTAALTATSAPVSFDKQRGVNYDVMCIFDDGTPANIEMMAFDQKYDYGKRAEYQVSRLETTYLMRGDDWEQAPKVYQISVLDFEYDRTSPDAVSRYAMRTVDGRELSCTLNVIFVELPKVIALEENIETNTALENWGIFLKEADNARKKEVIRKLTAKEAGLMQAQNALSSISENQELWLEQYRQEIFERDQRSSIHAAEKRGLAEGRASGLAEGRASGLAEGISKARLEAARNMLLAKLDVHLVVQCSGLPLETVQNLARELQR